MPAPNRARGTLDIDNPDAKYRCQEPIFAPHCVKLPANRAGISRFARAYATLEECEHGCRGLTPLGLVTTEIAPLMLRSPQSTYALPTLGPRTPEELEMASRGERARIRHRGRP